MAVIKTLNFRRTNFQVFKEVVDRMPWKKLKRTDTHLKSLFLESKYNPNLLIAALRPGKQKLSHDNKTAILH